MTENKRFQEYYQGNTIVSIYDKENDNELLNILQCVDLLNELHEENQQLKNDATTLICSNQEYRKENKQLKKQLSSILKLTKKIEDYTHDIQMIGDSE